ncbi:MAG: hypothetical protein ACQEWM_12485 [Actinomycetota bacterium]
MRTSPSRLLTTAAIVAVATMLGACAQPEPQETTAPDRPQSTPAVSATPSASAPSSAPAATAVAGAPGTATPQASVELVDLETQNGSMRMRIPAGWVVDDSSRVRTISERQGWSNEISIAVPDGGVLTYVDGLWGDAGAAPLEIQVVEQIPIGHGLAAAAWWEHFGEGSHSVGVGIIETASEPYRAFHLDDHPRLYSLNYYDEAFHDGFDSQAAAEDYLASDLIGLVLDAMATVEFSDDQEALPTAVGVQHEGTTYLPYTTRNGSATFFVPQDWWIRDDSGPSTNMAGQEVWNNAVTIADVGGGAMLGYHDMEFTNYVEDLEWTLGEVRPTTENPQWQAVSWALGDAVPHQGGHVGVSLTDRNGTERPADRVCTERMCRDFSSLPLSPSYFGGELESTEDFFGSDSEERMLTVVASLQTHHDDPTRMP